MSATSFDHARLRETMGYFATGVAIVTGMDEGLPYGFTCQSFCSLSLEPPMVAIAPGKRSASWPHVARSRCFCVNILAEDQEVLSRDFAVSGGDKFVGVAWRPGPLTGAPVLDGALAWAECRLGEIFDSGDHELVTGNVVSLGVGEGHPLLFYRGGFGTFGP